MAVASFPPGARHLQKMTPPRNLKPIYACSYSWMLALTVEMLLSSLKNGKAFGRDALPSETYKVCPSIAATIVAPLYRKAFGLATEPLQFKGGVIHDLLKSHGVSFECESSRGILISDILGKGYRKLVRNRTVPFLEKYTLDTMCGSLLHRGTDFASHILYSIMDFAKHKRSSLICVYVDILR